jgi:hypothetical protein
MAGFTPNAATTAGYGQLPTKPVPVESLDPSQIAQAEAAGYRQIGGMMVPPISGPASPGMSPTQANAIPGSSASPTNTSGYGPMPGSGTLPNQPTPVSQLMPETIDQAVKQGYQVAGGMLLPPVAGPASSTPKVGTFDESNTSGAAPTNPGAGTLQGMLDNLGQAVQSGVNSLAGYGTAAGSSSPYGPSAGEAYGAEMDAAREFDARKAAGGAGPHPSSTDPAERGAASSPSSGTESPGRINVNGVMMTPEEYSAYMGGAGSSPDRAAEAERAAANGGQPTAGFNPSDPFGVNAPATPPDVPNGGPGSPGYNSAPRPEDDLAGWRDYDNNGIDDRKQNFVGSGVFNNPGAIMPGAAGTSPVGGWGNAVNTGLGGPVDFGGGGGGGPSLGGYGDLGGYPSGGGTAGSGGNFTAPGAGGGGFTIPPAPEFTFPDVSTIGGGTGTSGGTGTGTGAGGFTFPTFENPLGGGGTTGGGTTGSGSTGGTGVATTTGGGGTGTNPLVGQLAGSYQTAIDSANMANENRFATGLELLLKRAEQAGSSIQNLTNEGMRDIGRNYDQQRSRADQDLINRGLGNTTVREGIFRGYTTDETAARNRFTDTQVRQNIDENFRQQQGMVDWLGARNDVGPDVGQLANLASGVGAAGPAAGATTPTAGAATPTATTPTAGAQPATQPATPRVTTPANPNGAFTKSSAPNPTINQPAASPQAATSLAGYGQSPAAPQQSPATTGTATSQPAPREDIFQRFASFNPAAGSQASNSTRAATSTASPAAPQTPTAESMFGDYARQMQGVIGNYVSNASARQQNKAELAANAGPIQIGPTEESMGRVSAQNRAASDAAMAAQRAAAEAGQAKNRQWEQQAQALGLQRFDRNHAGVDSSFYADPSTVKQDNSAIGGIRESGPTYKLGQGLPATQQPSTPTQPLRGADPLTMPGSSPQSSGFPAGIDMAQFGGGGAQSINNRNPSQTGMPNPPPPSISGTINGQTFMSGGMAPSTPATRPLVGAPPLTMPTQPLRGANPLTMPGMGPQPTPAGPSLMGYPDSSQQSQQMMSQARDMAMLSAPPPSSGPKTPWGVGQTFESGYKPSMVATPPQGMYTPGATAPGPIGASPVSAMASGMPTPPPPSSYQPPSLPFGTDQVQANQVSIGPDGIPTFTAPSGQRKPVAYYQSLGQYGVTA